MTHKIKEKENRIYRKRYYYPLDVRNLFKIPDDEMFLNIYWDKELNEVVIETIVDKEKNK